MFIGTASHVYSVLARPFIMTLPSLKSRNFKKKIKELEEIINTQRKIIHHMKEQKMKKLHSILIIVDDFADDPKFVRYTKFLHGLSTRGRHDAISFCLSVQKYRVLAPIIRLNSSSLCTFKLKNVSELISIIEETLPLLIKSNY